MIPMTAARQYGYTTVWMHDSMGVGLHADNQQQGLGHGATDCCRFLFQESESMCDSKTCDSVTTRPMPLGGDINPNTKDDSPMKIIAEAQISNGTVSRATGKDLKLNRNRTYYK